MQVWILKVNDSAVVSLICNFTFHNSSHNLFTMKKHGGWVVGQTHRQTGRSTFFKTKIFKNVVLYINNNRYIVHVIRRLQYLYDGLQIIIILCGFSRSNLLLLSLIFLVSQSCCLTVAVIYFFVICLLLLTS